MSGRCAHGLALRVLVDGIGIRVQEAGGERLDAGRFDEVAHRRPGALEVQGREHLSVVTHPLANPLAMQSMPRSTASRNGNSSPSRSSSF